VHRGAIAHLHQVLDDHPDVGIVAPRIVDDAGRTTDSLHNEPTVARGFADAVLGPVWRSRPAALSEWVRGDDAYRAPRDADWVSGAALLVMGLYQRRAVPQPGQMLSVKFGALK